MQTQPSLEKAKVIDSLYNISNIVNANLDKKTVQILCDLVELGVDPDSLVDGKTLFID
jgi:hypothetical protein